MSSSNMRNNSSIGIGNTGTSPITTNMNTIENSQIDSSNRIIDENVRDELSSFEQHGEFTKLHSVLIDGGDRFGVSTITFDLSEELVWVGNQGGHVTSYYGSNLEKYTSFQVHPTQEIRQILTTEDFILILSETQLRGQLRRGIPLFTHTSENMLNMQCILQTKPNVVLLGGLQEELIEFDIGALKQSQTIPLNDSGCAILRNQNRLIFTGEPTGKIHLLDSRTFRKEQSIEAHSGSLSDFDVHGNLMVTCGFSNRHSNLSVDRFLKVYDIRMLRALAPIQVSVDPFLLRFLPSFSSRIITVSPTGQMEILETQMLSQTNICLYQVTNAGMCSSFDVSSSCHQMAFGDTNGTLQLFSSNSSSMFNSFSRDTEFPDSAENINIPYISIFDQNASYASIPMFFPENGSKLLSEWSVESCRPSFRPIQPIDPIILQTMKMIGPIGYAPNPTTFRPNQVMYPVNPLVQQNQAGIETNATTNNTHHHPPNNSISTPMTIHSSNNNKNIGHGCDGIRYDNSPANWNNINGHGNSPMGTHSTFPPLTSYNGSPTHHIQIGGSPGKHHHNLSPQRGSIHHNSNIPHMFQQSQGSSSSNPSHQFFHYNGPGSSNQSQQQLIMSMQPSSSSAVTTSGGAGSNPVRSYFPKSNNMYMKNAFYPGKRSNFNTSRFQVPKRYAKYEWKKNFFEEADMENFNKTKLSGLEFSQANSYCNSILQALYHIDHLRIALMSHLCEKEACISCELGFLFHMLDNTRAIPCVASNFLRAFRLVPEASALGLILQENQSRQRGIFLRLIQSFNRFLLHQIESETKDTTTAEEGEPKESENAVSKLFEMKQENLNRCTRCGKEETKETKVLLSNILYTAEGTGGGKRCNFIELVERSLVPEQTTPAWCEQCSKYQPTFQRRVPKSLPPFLSFNTCLDNAHDFQLWRNHMETTLSEKGGKSDVEIPPVGQQQQKFHVGGNVHPKSCRYGRHCVRPDCKFWHEGRQPVNSPTSQRDHGKLSEFELNPETQVKWLPITMRLSIESGNKVAVSEVVEDSDSSKLCPKKIEDGLEGDYELMSVVCFIRDSESEEKNNLVSLVNVSPTYFERFGQSNVKSQWYLFNDFSIREVGVSEAHSFNPKWKIPSVVYYRKKMEHLELVIPEIPKLKSTVTIDVFKRSISTIEGKDIKSLTYKPLDEDEIPKKGDLVAMDAEFVTLGQEETELRSDGKIATTRPQMGVARITCVRGQGKLEGTPFIDDFISTQEVVVDYLTKFSGIKPGDLDVNQSSKKVSILKNVYLKLRFLIDSGVKFVGHGLNNDFRMINVAVPPEQIIDTVNLFYLQNQRMISLRFLAWHFLGEVIQSEVHDSIEDARTALRLYRKYEELKKEGKLQESLEELYQVGKKVQFKVPSGNAGNIGENDGNNSTDIQNSPQK